MKLVARPYQEWLEQEINSAWADGVTNVLGVLPTGGGKTFVFSRILQQHQGPAVAIAHRQELVLQISCSLAAHGVSHNIIAPKNVIKFVVNKHMRLYGESFYSPNSQKAVAGVGTLLSRAEALAPWLETVTLWVQDECHHVLRANQWGKVTVLMPNARGLGVTATPTRADGRGLGLHADGVFEKMIVGPTMRSIIDDGWLTDYKVLTVPSDLNLDAVPISKATGDYSKPQLSVEVEKSHIVGDVVEHYLKYAKGLLGVTFVTDVATGSKVAAEFNAKGVRAECISHKTDDRTRDRILQMFEKREVMQLVNVDLFGEGFDLPAVQCISFARPTASYSLFAQQFGRGIRLLLGDGCDMSTPESRLASIASSTKPRAIILDHVGNVMRHGLPDHRSNWTMDARERKSKGVKDDVTPVRTCINPQCMATYERTEIDCPYCGLTYVPAERQAPEFVDGDLMELDAAMLAHLRGKVDEVDQSEGDYRQALFDNRCPRVGIERNVNAHLKTQRVQVSLRHLVEDFLADYADPRIAQKRFFWRYGVDILSAQSLKPAEAKDLAERIAMDF